MKTLLGAALATVLVAGSASAQLRLQFDVNGSAIQARDSAGAAKPFSGLGHTGSVDLFYSAAGPTILNGLSIGPIGGPSFAQTVGFALTDFQGTVKLNAGQVVGGSIMIKISNGDTYKTDIRVGPGLGQVLPYVGGGFKIEGLTFNGKFSDAQFGLVDVAPFFAAQSGGGGALLGDFIQFNFSPNATGGGFADMDLFVVVPLPPAGWAGLGTLAGVMALGYVRRRK